MTENRLQCYDYNKTLLYRREQKIIFAYFVLAKKCECLSNTFNYNRRLSKKTLLEFWSIDVKNNIFVVIEN